MRNPPYIILSIIFSAITICMWRMEVFEWVIIPTLASFILIMIAILQIRLERIPKGVLLIILGVSFGILLPKNIIPNEVFSQEKIDDLIGKIEIIRSLAIYACSGAGASIIAGHAKRYLHENDKDNKSNETFYAENIHNLNKTLKEIERIKSHFIYLYALLVFLIFVFIWNAI